MLSEEKLNEYRETIQKILDKYLPEDKRISTKDMSQEWLYFFASYLTEKDENKRQELWDEWKKEVNRQMKDAEAEYEEAKKKLSQDYAEITTTKEKYDNIMNALFGSASSLNNLMNDVDAMKEMEDEINKLS